MNILVAPIDTGITTGFLFVVPEPSVGEEPYVLMNVNLNLRKANRIMKHIQKNNFLSNGMYYVYVNKNPLRLKYEFKHANEVLKP